MDDQDRQYIERNFEKLESNMKSFVDNKKNKFKLTEKLNKTFKI